MQSPGDRSSLFLYGALVVIVVLCHAPVSQAQRNDLFAGQTSTLRNVVLHITRHNLP